MPSGPVAVRVGPLLALATFLAHALTASGYGWFRDELYYIACGKRLSFGYVDHPPLIAVITAAARTVTGDSRVGLRLVPALCAALTVWVAVSMTRRLGGGTFAQVTAGIATALAPVYVALFSIHTMNAPDVLLWGLILWLALRLLDGADPRLWAALGAAGGLGLLNKLSAGFLLAGIAAGVLLTPARKMLRSPWPWLGAAIALVMFSPHLAWQQAHGWPTLEFIRNATAHKNVPFAAGAFLGEQFLFLNPLAVLLWLPGLVFLLVARGGRYRPLGIAFLAVLALLLTQNAKPYYLAPAYTLLFAAGAAWLEGRGPLRRATRARWALPVLLGLSGLALAPLAKALLPVETLVRYSRAIGLGFRTDERQALGRLPQFFADMHGWPELAASVRQAVTRLTPEERARACVVARNYGDAAAVEFFGRDLPPVVSGHNSYWLWGPGSCDGSVVLIIGEEREDHASDFESLEEGAVFDCTDCMPYEDGQRIWIGRGLKRPVAEVWPAIRQYI